MAENKIKEGDRAPLFELDSYNAGKIDLKDLIGKQKIVLIFSRYFGCNLCQLDLNILLAAASDIEKKGAKLLYITQSGEKIAKEFIEKKDISFPVIYSTKDELYTDYGLGMMTKEAASQIREKLKEATKEGIQHGEFEGWEKQGPGQFIINEDGIIIHRKEGWLDIPSLMDNL